jgi:hypothetical protein
MGKGIGRGGIEKKWRNKEWREGGSRDWRKGRKYGLERGMGKGLEISGILEKESKWAVHYIEKEGKGIGEE